MKFFTILLISISLFGKQCVVYEEAFVTSADLYEDTKNCYDLKYSILSFKQMILMECDMDPDYVTIIWYLQNQYTQNCEK
jgi:hypothetical protein